MFTEAKTEESIILVLARNGRMHLMNRCLIGVYLTSMHLTGAHLMRVSHRHSS